MRVNINNTRMLVDVTILQYSCTAATMIAVHCRGEQASICSRVRGSGARILETVCLTDSVLDRTQFCTGALQYPYRNVNWGGRNIWTCPDADIEGSVGKTASEEGGRRLA